MMISRVATLLLAVALATPVSARSRPTGRCVDTERIVSRRAVSPDTLELGLAGGAAVRARFARVCPHLAEIDRTYTLELEEPQGRTLCAGDRVRVIDPLVARSGGTASYPSCPIASLTTVPAQR